MSNLRLMRLTVDLPSDEDKARAMRKWLKYLEDTGYLGVYLEALYECNVGGYEEEWEENSEGRLKACELVGASDEYPTALMLEKKR